ncbi:hypothetical protein PGT21_036275 [Puccinia graminis f. sp. tritici]|uniref:Uncharacterized protein n=1 Tax=Puccinia graminis f. sp. tritici TaxID=56615 RepID=A0A5B0Q048_PUCGR|nr:hypothetical protein PGT21_036275 [Puccinia graminis f. sp. tritici]
MATANVSDIPIQHTHLTTLEEDNEMEDLQFSNDEAVDRDPTITSEDKKIFKICVELQKMKMTPKEFIGLQPHPLEGAWLLDRHRSLLPVRKFLSSNRHRSSRVTSSVSLHRC